MFDKILVPTDGSETARAALEKAVHVALKHNADLHVLHVIDEIPSTRNPAMLEKKQNEQQEQAEQLVEDAVSGVEDADVRTHSAVRRGQPHEAVLEYTRDNEVDLIIMGRHGRSGLNRLLLGSTAERVLRSSDIPVLVIPPVEE